MQVDGYSLDAQKDKLKKYAEFQDMVVAGEYSDEGKSGKNIEGRPQFLQMLKDIESGKDKVEFVLVFKLSRFGRNAADVLSSLQRMQDFGVNLICVEDGIDSSKDSGKLMISVLSAVAEIERENILVQTMEGRRQKAREGKWNGGLFPDVSFVPSAILLPKQLLHVLHHKPGNRPVSQYDTDYGFLQSFHSYGDHKRVFHNKPDCLKLT